VKNGFGWVDGRFLPITSNVSLTLVFPVRLWIMRSTVVGMNTSTWLYGTDALRFLATLIFWRTRHKWNLQVAPRLSCLLPWTSSTLVVCCLQKHKSVFSPQHQARSARTACISRSDKPIKAREGPLEEGMHCSNLYQLARGRYMHLKIPCSYNVLKSNDLCGIPSHDGMTEEKKP